MASAASKGIGMYCNNPGRVESLYVGVGVSLQGTRVSSAPSTSRQDGRGALRLVVLRASGLLDHSLSLADLGRETGLDGSDGTPGTAAVAGDEVQSVLTLVELGIGAAASLAGDVFDNVSTQNVLDLLLLEATLDDKTSATVDGTGSTQFGEQELGDVFVGSFMRLQISAMLAKMVFLLPSRRHCGGGIL